MEQGKVGEAARSGPSLAMSGRTVTGFNRIEGKVDVYELRDGAYIHCTYGGGTHVRGLDTGCAAPKINLMVVADRQMGAPIPRAGGSEASGWLRDGRFRVFMGKKELEGQECVQMNEVSTGEYCRHGLERTNYSVMMREPFIMIGLSEHCPCPFDTVLIPDGPKGSLLGSLRRKDRPLAFRATEDGGYIASTSTTYCAAPLVKLPVRLVGQ